MHTPRPIVLTRVYVPTDLSGSAFGLWPTLSNRIGSVTPERMWTLACNGRETGVSDAEKAQIESWAEAAHVDLLDRARYRVAADREGFTI